MPERLEAPGATTYGGYLGLETLLGAQLPRSQAHDELLFIVVHQTSELWMKLSLAELTAARERIAADDLRPAFKMLTRVARIQQQLIGSWDVLATMTPSEYSEVRPHLGPSSGFQSAQYRLTEFVLGARSRAHAERHDGPERAALEAELVRPSLYDAALALLARRGFPLTPRTRFDAPYVPSPEVEAAWRGVYEAPEAHWDLYELAEKLVDVEYRLQLWRFAHLKTVERIIGFKRGTGGTAGAPYLEGVLKQVFFPELLSVRTVL